MSRVRISPELLATVQDGTVVKVVAGGCPVSDAGILEIRLEDTVLVLEVNDGQTGVRQVEFQEVDPLDDLVAGAIIEKHRRQVVASPGVGQGKRAYALRVLDDILADLRAQLL